MPTNFKTLAPLIIIYNNEFIYIYIYTLYIIVSLNLSVSKSSNLEPYYVSGVLFNNTHYIIIQVFILIHINYT